MGIPTSAVFRVLCLTLVTNSPSLCTGLIWDYFHIQTNTAISNTQIFGTESAVDATHCALYCVANSSCLSASYNNVSRECHLSLYHINSLDDDLFPQSSSVTLTRQGCPDEWVRIGQKCYFFSSEKGIQADALALCTKYGGKLVEPQTNATHQLLKNYLIEMNNDDRFWIGLIVKEQAGNFTFVWSSTDVAPAYTDWDSGEPLIQFSGDRCIEIYDNYRWKVVRCRTNKQAICEQ